MSHNVSIPTTLESTVKTKPGRSHQNTLYKIQRKMWTKFVLFIIIQPYILQSNITRTTECERWMYQYATHIHVTNQWGELPKHGFSIANLKFSVANWNNFLTNANELSKKIQFSYIFEDLHVNLNKSYMDIYIMVQMVCPSQVWHLKGALSRGKIERKEHRGCI